MLLAFLLIVIVEGDPEDTEDMYFRDVSRCNYFAYRIETGDFSTSKYHYHDHQRKVTAYCLPKMVAETTKFWD